MPYFFSSVGCPLFFIRYLPDGSFVIIRNIDRPIRALCQTAGTMLRTTGSRLVRPTREIDRKYSPLTIGLAILKRLKDYIIPLLRLGSPVPAAVKGDKGAILIFLRELIAGIEQQPIRRKVTGESHHGILCILTRRLLSITAIFRSEYLFLLELVVKDIRPAAIRTLVQFIHTLCGQLGALFRIPYVREEIVQLVPAMHHNEQGIGGLIPVQRYTIPQPRSIA